MKYEDVEGKNFKYTRENYDALLEHFNDGHWSFEKHLGNRDPSELCLYVSYNDLEVHACSSSGYVIYTTPFTLDLRSIYEI